MFEMSIDFHDSASPRKRRFDTYSEAAQYLERVPNMLGFLSNKKATIEINTVSVCGPTLFDPQPST